MADATDDLIGYVTLGTNNLAKACVFYDEVLIMLGATRTHFREGVQFYGNRFGPMLGIFIPFDGMPATHGNGTMLALRAPSEDMVRNVHAAALAIGGKDEGGPDLRQGSFYGAYFRDLDSNKICVYYSERRKAKA